LQKKITKNILFIDDYKSRENKKNMVIIRNMPDNQKDMPVKALKACIKCGNPYFVNKGKELMESVCDNCAKLEQRKRELQLGVFKEVIKVENQMEDSINEMTNNLTVSKGTFNKKFYLEKIKKRAETLWKSVELIEKIESENYIDEFGLEKYIDEYKRLFGKLNSNIKS